MKTNFVLFCMLVALGLAGVNICSADTITLQQGLNGYSGCQDTFVNSSAYGEDSGVYYGINRLLILNSEHYESF
jgi:hypothetical protein